MQNNYPKMPQKGSKSWLIDDLRNGASSLDAIGWYGLASELRIAADIIECQNEGDAHAD